MPIRFAHCVVLAAALPPAALACSPCRSAVKAAIFDGSFVDKALVLLLPVLAIGFVAACIQYAGRQRKSA